MTASYPVFKPATSPEFQNGNDSGTSGGGRSGGEPYRRVGQTSGQSKSRRALRVAETLHLFFSSTLAHLVLVLEGDRLLAPLLRRRNQYDNCAQITRPGPVIDVDRLRRARQ